MSYYNLSVGVAVDIITTDSPPAYLWSQSSGAIVYQRNSAGDSGSVPGISFLFGTYDYQGVISGTPTTSGIYIYNFGYQINGANTTIPITFYVGTQEITLGSGIANVSSLSPFAFNVSTLAATNSHLPITASVLSGPATISGTPGGIYTVTPSGAGTVVIALNQGGNSTFLAAAQVTTSFIVAPTQTLTPFSTISNKLTTATPFTITAPTASSGLSVVLSILSGPATISGNTITLTGSAGTVTVAANQAGDSTYAPAPQVTTSFVVTQATQTISSFATIANQVPGASPFTITAPTASSGLSVVLSILSGPATISGNTITLTGSTGTVVVAANQAGNSSYSAAPQVTTSFAVAQLSQTIGSFPTIASQVPGASPFTITAPTASSGLSVVLSILSGPATISGNTITLTGSTGTVVVAANQSGNTNYLAAAQVTTSFSVAKLSQTLASFAAIATKFYQSGWSGNVFTITAPTASSGLSVVLSILSGPATISGNTITLTGQGTVIVAANQSGNTNYLAAPQVTASITALTPTIAISNLSQTYDTYPKPVTITTNPPALAYSVTYNGSATVPSALGSYAVVATITDSSSPSGISASATLTIVNKITGDPTVIPAWQLSIDQSTKAITAAPSPFACKYGDDLVFIIRFLSGGVPSLISGISNLTITAQEFGTSDILLQSVGFTYGIDALGYPFYAIYLSCSGAALLQCLGDGAGSLASTIALLAQVTWNEANAYSVGPSTLAECCPFFPLTVTRNLN